MLFIVSSPGTPPQGFQGVFGSADKSIGGQEAGGGSTICQSLLTLRSWRAALKRQKWARLSIHLMEHRGIHTLKGSGVHKRSVDTFDPVIIMTAPPWPVTWSWNIQTPSSVGRVSVFTLMVLDWSVDGHSKEITDLLMPLLGATKVVHRMEPGSELSAWPCQGKPILTDQSPNTSSLASAFHTARS